jgi:hypothetical protein
MVPYAALKLFEPLSAFGGDERAYWRAYASSGEEPRRVPAVMLSRESGLGTIATLIEEREQADILAEDGQIYVCPHRTRLRLLASVLAFRRTIPAEVASAFMPEGEAERAVEELERLRAEHPKWRTHILLSTWEVPLRWFVPFSDEDRSIQDGRIRYRTSMPSAMSRTHRALGVLRTALPDPGVVGLVADLARWLEEFDPASIVLLDYGGVGRLFSVSAQEADHSAADIGAAIEALEAGDPEGSAAFYSRAAERWGSVRARESSN